MIIVKKIKELIYESLNPKSIISSKRISLMTSQLLFAFQIFIDIIIYVILLLFVSPLPSIEFYKLMVSVQSLALLLNTLIILWNLGAIKNTDIAFAEIIKMKMESSKDNSVQVVDDSVVEEQLKQD